MKDLYNNVEESSEEIQETTTETTDEEVVSPEVEEEEPPINADGFTVDDLVTNYFFGIDLVDPRGNPFPKSLIISHINSAISWAEALFDICLTKQQVIGEHHDYERNDYMNWGFIQLWKRPVRSISRLRLMYGTEPSFEVPIEWLKIDKIGGKVQMFPAQGSANNLIISQSGVIFGLPQRWGYAPQMWEVDYEAGMDSGEIPPLLKTLVEKKAAMDIFTVWGDLILGAGIASQSISIDGLSQSIGTTQSAMYGGASARVEEYRRNIEDMVPIIRQQFSSMRMVVL